MKLGVVGCQHTVRAPVQCTLRRLQLTSSCQPASELGHHPEGLSVTCALQVGAVDGVVAGAGSWAVGHV